MNTHENAKVGDTVLMKEKNYPRLEWPTGTITEVRTAKDGLVRRVVVQPHARPGKSTTETPRERAIHDLILLRSLTDSEQKPQMDTTALREQEEIEAAEQILKTTEQWERMLRQEQIDKQNR